MAPASPVRPFQFIIYLRPAYTLSSLRCQASKSQCVGASCSSAFRALTAVFADKYTVTLDGITLPLDGYSEAPAWDEPLYMVSNLRDGSHTLAIQNDSDNSDPEMSYLDIDTVRIFKS